jgi:hypothetical protein
VGHGLRLSIFNDLEVLALQIGDEFAGLVGYNEINLNKLGLEPNDRFSLLILLTRCLRLRGRRGRLLRVVLRPDSRVGEDSAKNQYYSRIDDRSSY